jgi:hypothetical protein
MKSAKVKWLLHSGWHFFVSNNYYAHQVANLNHDVIDQVLKILLAAYYTTKRKYTMSWTFAIYHREQSMT